MKKIILILSLVFTVQSMAIAAPASGLKAAYEDYVYATTVEWDQVDAKEIAAINSRFAEVLADLKAEGLLTESHVKEFFNAEVRAGRVPQEVLLQILTPAGELKTSALSEVLKSQQQNLSAQGASWNGDAGRKIFRVVAWGFLPALIIVAVITQDGRKEMCTLSGDGYGLHQPFACN